MVFQVRKWGWKRLASKLLLIPVLTGEAATQRVELRLRRHAPRHFAQGRAVFERGRQRRIVRESDEHGAAVQRFEA